MLVLISTFPVLLVNPVNIILLFVAVISSKPGMEMDYKNPLIHSARDETYFEVIKNYESFLNHYFTHGVIFLKNCAVQFRQLSLTR